MKLVQKYPVLGSSQNPEELALRIKSALYALIPAIVLVGKLAGLELVGDDLQSYVDALSNVIIYGGFLITGLLHIWAWIRAYKK